MSVSLFFRIVPFVLPFWLMAAGCTTTPAPTGTDDGGNGGSCKLDSECPTATPRCDLNTGKCQPCLPTSDNCVGGTRCVPVNDGYACSTKCGTDADCPKSDAGTAQTCCDSACIDVSADTRNCGACGRACPQIANGSAACVSGVCVVGECAAGFGDCDKNAANGCEAPTSSDIGNCGQCGTVCAVGINAAAVCTSGGCGVQCQSGFGDCDKSPANGCEVSTASDVNNCGGCNMACGTLPNATVGCAGGACAIFACNSGFADCDNTAANGCEANKLTDASNCGACGKVCSYPNAAGSCQSGACSLGACNTGYSNCDGISSNGCETPTASDSFNCGGCGVRCMGANSTQSCVSSKCVVTQCTTGYADCDGDASNGCEAKITTDVGNCGGCGKACPAAANSTATCTNGTCGIGSCKFGYADCDMSATNGCEANLLDPISCGFCGNVCSAPTNATAGCNAGACGIGTCNALWGDCDKAPANGCEKSLATDVNNCGACGKACSLAHATALCLGGQCGISTCATGYSDCDNNAATGCESQTSNDPMNCGACNKVCPSATNATATCSSSVCGLNCLTGYANCDGNLGNGCEINTWADLSNCGTCGKVCGAVPNGMPACLTGSCGIGSCNTNYADCNNTVSDGCETNVATSLAHCGACGKACSFPGSVAACLGGQCGWVSCQSGYADCDNNTATGCEVNLNSSASNCGACGKVCPSGTPNCLAGTCVAQFKVLIVAGDYSGFGGAVQTSLRAFSDLTTVDVFDASNGTPTVPMLGNYNAVLVFSYAHFYDPATLGNNLATYIDNGGQVVAGQTAWETAPNGDYTIGGRFATTYALIATGTIDSSVTGSLGTILEPGSPLLAGVSSVSSAWRNRSSGTVNGGIRVANWSDGSPFIVRGTINGHNRVDLNMPPMPSTVLTGGWTGDGAKVLHNALIYR